MVTMHQPVSKIFSLLLLLYRYVEACVEKYEVKKIKGPSFQLAVFKP